MKAWHAATGASAQFVEKRKIAFVSECLTAQKMDHSTDAKRTMKHVASQFSSWAVNIGRCVAFVETGRLKRLFDGA